MVNSAFGHPLSRSYGTSTKTYTFNVDSYEICYLQPTDVAAQSQPWGPGLMKYPLGYNPAVFTPAKGFSKPDLVSAGKTFPTTGFNNAKFLLKMSNVQSDYTYASDNVNVNISNVLGSEGLVTLGPNKPVGTITLTATPKPPVTAPASIHSFVISLWARPVGTTSYLYSTSTPISTATEFPAASMCKDGTETSVTNATDAASYFFTRAQLTNSPFADNSTYPAGTSPAYPGNNYYSRDADTTFTGEWGSLIGYSSSGWSGYAYWTGEAWDSTYQFLVNTYYGYVGYDFGSIGYNVVCSH